VTVPSTAAVLGGSARWGVDCQDAIEWLRALPDDSIHCWVTSPPYYGLRDYGNAGQIGLEPTPAEYVARLTDVFREARRALHPSGVLWLNLGDSYAGSPPGCKGVSGASSLNGVNSASGTYRDRLEKGHGTKRDTSKLAGFKPKDLLGIPWRVAFSLQADGWHLRQWCPWVKRNPMPESVTDRPATACECVFLLTKSPSYFFDMEAVKRAGSGNDERPQRKRAMELAEEANPTPEHIASIRATGATDVGQGASLQTGTGKNTAEVQRLAAEAKTALGDYFREFLMSDTRNFRNADLWFDSAGMLLAGTDPGADDLELLGLDVTLRAYKGAHFAVMPKELVRPLVRCGSSEHGVCSACGAPWRRVVEKTRKPTRPGKDTKTTGDSLTDGNRDPQRHCTTTETTGWEAGCKCDAGTTAAVVGDMFAGSGTVPAVAVDEGRRSVGCELNPDYLPLIRKRMRAVTPSLLEART